MATIDILIPTYNGSKYISETIKSILSQSFKKFKIIICDDASKDNTINVIKKIKDKRIEIHQHQENVGYSKNLERGRQYVTGDFLYLMGQDDILGSNALQNTYKAFQKSPNIGAVTRPYFWFDKNISEPVRAKKQLNSKRDEVVKITSKPEKIKKVFETLDQLSGLAYRVKFFDIPFHEDIFPCHIYPFASIFKKHPVVFLKDYNLAVRISSSQTRSLSSIYNKSPILSWKEMIDNVYSGNKYKKIKNYLIQNFIAMNYVGLVQIKNYSYYKNLIREIYYLIKFRPLNLINLYFWFFSLGCLITPPKILIPLVDWYKNKINSKTLPNIKFKYNLK